MALLVGLKISNGNFFDYCKMYQQYRRRAHTKQDKAVLVETLFDTIFIMGLKDFQPLEKELNEIFGSKKWPTADQCIERFSTTITVRSAMSSDKELKAGMVEANRSKIEGEDRRAVAALLAKFTRGGGGKPPSASTVQKQTDIKREIAR